jgi:hypothetical protein
MNRGLKPAFRYQATDLLKSAAVFFAVMMALCAAVIIDAFSVSTSNSSFKIIGSSSFTGMGTASAICLFIFGITAPRSNLRLCTQLGVSRRSAFLSLLLSALAVSAALAAAGEVLTGSLQHISIIHVRINFADLYQMIYVGSTSVTLPFAQHLNSALLVTCLLLCCFMFGVFFTFLFWRLNKGWRIVAAISIPFLINGVPALLYRFGVDMKPLFVWLGSRVYHLDLFLLLLALFFAAIEWLLLRRAYIRSPSST